MKSEKRLELIKILLCYIVETNRKQEKFVEFLSENDDLYQIDMTLKNGMPYYEIAEELNVKSEENAEGMYEFLCRKDKTVEQLVEEFCEKYKI